MPLAAGDPARPVVAVIGTTGSGKSQLAVSLAKSLASQLSRRAPALETDNAVAGPSRPRPTRGIVLSADSMQLYRGLDVITNKVTPAEMGGVEHWGLDMVQPGEGGSWELGKWCSEADDKVDTLPIICGGTHYFIQHFLFPPGEVSFERPREAQAVTDLRWVPPRPRPDVELDDDSARLLDTFWTPSPVWPPDAVAPAGSAGSAAPLGSVSRSRPGAETDAQLLAVWRLLEAVDPPEAGRWHWRDGRKVRRALERWWERGGLPVAASHKDDSDVDDKPGRDARFKTLIFWVYEAMDVLRPRLDGRVDRMVENGLMDEIVELRAVASRVYGPSTDTHDHTEGIFQAIGYKEFAALRLPQDRPMADPLFPAMLERTKLSTQQYAKSQLRWIRKQLLPAVKEARSRGGDVVVYVVKGGEDAAAVDVLQAWLDGQELPDPNITGHPDAAKMLSLLDQADDVVPDTAARQLLNSRRVCEACSEPGQPFSVAVRDWSKHVSSRMHISKTTPVVSREDRIAAAKARGEQKRLERIAMKSARQVEAADQVDAAKQVDDTS